MCATLLQRIKTKAFTKKYVIQFLGKYCAYCLFVKYLDRAVYECIIVDVIKCQDPVILFSSC